MTTLYVRDVSGFQEAQAADLLDLTQALVAQRWRIGSRVPTSPGLTHEFLRVNLGACEHEIFGVLSPGTEIELHRHQPSSYGN
jgi:hypothetical protein